MPGRKPKPTALKLAQGNPGKRTVRKDEPQFPVGFGGKPDGLSEVASAEWDRLEPLLEDAGLAAPVAVGPFTMLCVNWADWCEAREKLKTEPAVIFDKEHGRWMRNPWALVAKQAYDQYLKLCIEFGLTPSSKSRAATFSTPKNKKKENKFAVFRGS